MHSANGESSLTTFSNMHAGLPGAVYKKEQGCKRGSNRFPKFAVVLDSSAIDP